MSKEVELLHEAVNNLANVTRRLDHLVSALTTIAKHVDSNTKAISSLSATVGNLAEYVTAHERKIASCMRCKNFEPQDYDKKRTEEISGPYPALTRPRGD